MSDELSEDSPTPVVPLSYYDGDRGPWAAVAKFLGWAGIINATVVIVAQISSLAVYGLQRMFGGNISFASGFGAYLLFAMLPIAAAGVMLVGSIGALRLRRSARPLVIWGSASVCIWWSLSWLINLLIVRMGRYSTGWTFWTSQIVNGLMNALFRCFVPAMLWIAFRRREVRDVFEHA
jgi:hypothetical protein